MQFGIALPSWIVDKKNSMWVLGAYMLAFIIILPVVVVGFIFSYPKLTIQMILQINSRNSNHILDPKICSNYMSFLIIIVVILTLLGLGASRPAVSIISILDILRWDILPPKTLANGGKIWENILYSMFLVRARGGIDLSSTAQKRFCLIQSNCFGILFIARRTCH